MPVSQRARRGQPEQMSVDSLNEANGDDGLSDKHDVVINMVHALIAFGAPSHNIADYATDLINIIGMKGSVAYALDSTLVSFKNRDDMTYRTKLVTASNGIFLGACDDTFRVYQLIMARSMTPPDANRHLTALLSELAYFKSWRYLPLYGLASSFVCLFAFGGGWYDMGPSFLLGSFVTMLQDKVPKRVKPRDHFVVEVVAVFIATFCAHAFASIHHGNLFCYKPIAMSAIVSTLPGYACMVGTLELLHPSTSTTGVTRLVKAAALVVLLTYGISLSGNLWGLISKESQDQVCSQSVDPRWKFLFAPLTLVLMGVRNGSRLRQIPMQVVLGSAAYTVQTFVGNAAGPKIAMTAAAFTLGLLGNLYALIWNQFAFSAMVIGVLLLVPGGMSLEGPLIKEMFELVVALAMGLLLSGLAFYRWETPSAFFY
ncbi:hypothetical protein PG993_013503 [Apiospora rasikravindrae]|uniref:Threonine/serine exporter-like N-terminal domain-containing protein n=1 Tax=Apiospora rasikravindrae TaxID=990691 RepID=A0ABR1RXT6_9PEZI